MDNSPPEVRDSTRPNARLARLWALVLLAVLAFAAGKQYVGFATNPEFEVNSDDLLWMWRFVNLPRPALPTIPADYVRMKYLPGPNTPKPDLDYINGLDQPALERWIMHVLLDRTGRLPDSLRDIAWDYDRDYQWNLANGNVAPPDAVRFVRVVNAAFMIAAVLLLYVAVARSVTPLAGFVTAISVVLHSALVDVMWSIGSDPLLWLCMSAALAAWVFLGTSVWSAVLVGLLGGLAASAKINGGVVAAGAVLWLVLNRRWRFAVLCGGIALLVFIIVNPICFSKGLFGVPSMLWELVRWRSIRADMIAAHYPMYAEASQWKVPFYLLGPWWPLVPLLLVSRKFYRLDPLVWWSAALAVGHLAVVNAPLPRYTFPMQVGLLAGLIGAYWPTRSYALRRLRACLRPLRQETP